jgi:DNA topoisomerase IB
MARLKRVDPSLAGIRRRGRGRGYEYRDADGKRIADAVTLERLRDLAIPPAWKDVWICPQPVGHIQATGVDEAGRRQYLYHERWRERRNQLKYDSALRFGHSLPRLRRRVRRDLRADDLGRERVLACAVRLLDHGFFRIGGEEYAASNGSYGLATLRKRHVSLNGTAIVFDYTAKGGQRLIQEVADREVRAVIERLKRRRGGPSALLAYRDDGRWRNVRSDDINAYIKDVVGDGFSAKDFRTWHATVLAAVELAAAPEARSKTARRRVISESIETVAEQLGNTPAVCRSSYVDPRLFDRYLDGDTIRSALPPGNGRLGPRQRRRIEQAVIDLLA